ncbi:cation:H+ antiporter [Spirochaetota bacterium]|nr:cation:H+ antiporter [Spirochaetota bacterium]
MNLPTLLALTYFLVGLAMLIKGADILINQAMKIATRLKISPLIVGIVLVSFGTSLPELAVSIAISIEQGPSDIIVGNVLGSNIANGLLVLGTAAALGDIVVSKEVLKTHLSMGAIALLLFVLFYFYVTPYTIDSVEGLGVLLAMGIYLCLLYYFSLKKKAPQSTSSANLEHTAVPKQELEVEQSFSWGKVGSLLVISIVLIGGGSEWVSHNVLVIATTVFNSNEAFAGVILLALGTSLPELVTSIVAFRKGENDLLLGNVLGSNIFNLLAIIGVSAVVAPLTAISDYTRELWVNGVIIMIIVLFSFTGKAYTLSRRNGIIFLMLYLVYLQAFLNENIGG